MVQHIDEVLQAKQWVTFALLGYCLQDDRFDAPDIVPKLPFVDVLLVEILTILWVFDRSVKI